MTDRQKWAQREYERLKAEKYAYEKRILDINELLKTLERLDNVR